LLFMKEKKGGGRGERKRGGGAMAVSACQQGEGGKEKDLHFHSKKKERGKGGGGKGGQKRRVVSAQDSKKKKRGETFPFHGASIKRKQNTPSSFFPSRDGYVRKKGEETDFRQGDPSHQKGVSSPSQNGKEGKDKQPSLR